MFCFCGGYKGWWKNKLHLRFEQDLKDPQIVFSLSLIYLSPQFCSNLWSLPLLLNLYPCFSGKIMMREYSIWWWAPPPMRLGWFLKSCPLFHHVMSRIREGTYFLPLRWRSSNLCSMLNPMFGWWIPPRHYLMFLAHMGFCWKVLPGGVPYLGCFVIPPASMDLSRVEIVLKWA